MDSQTVFLIGLGNMGSVIANVIAEKGYEVFAWEYDKDVVEEVNTKHTNSKYLPGYKLHPNIKATNLLSEFKKAIYDKDGYIVLVAIPVRYAVKFINRLINSDVYVKIISFSKGLDDNGNTLSNSLIIDEDKYLFVGGPMIAKEIIDKKYTLSFAVGSPSLFEDLTEIMETDYLKFSYLTRYNVENFELTGVIKNIYAIGSGIIQGINGENSLNLLSYYIQLVEDEASSIFTSSLQSLVFKSDFIATSLSPNSHHVRFGKLLAQGKSINEIKKIMGTLPEGYFAISKFIEEAKQEIFGFYKIMNFLNAIIKKKIPAKKFIEAIYNNFYL